MPSYRKSTDDTPHMAVSGMSPSWPCRRHRPLQTQQWPDAGAEHGSGGSCRCVCFGTWPRSSVQPATAMTSLPTTTPPAAAEPCLATAMTRVTPSLPVSSVMPKPAYMTIYHHISHDQGRVLAQHDDLPVGPAWVRVTVYSPLYEACSCTSGTRRTGSLSLAAGRATEAARAHLCRGTVDFVVKVS